MPPGVVYYLDNAATSFPKPEAVYQAMDAFARSSLANPGRAGHKMALASERVLDDARHLLNQLFHGKEPPAPTGFPGLLMASPRTADPAIVGRAIDEIAAACRGGQARLALTLLGRLVTEFEHNSEGLIPVANRP